MNIILIGFIHSGKTTFGRALSSMLERPFIDTDKKIEQLFQKEKKINLNYRQIYQQYGKNYFRYLEKRVVLELFPVKKCVISVGGGTVLDPENVKVLKQVGRLVYIKVAKEQLKERFLKDTPSYADPNDPVLTFERMYKNCKGICETITDFEIEVPYGK